MKIKISIFIELKTFKMPKKLNLLVIAMIVIASSSQAQKRLSGSSKTTSPRMATTASATLRNPSATKTEKSLAGSTLSQSRGKKN